MPRRFRILSGMVAPDTSPVPKQARVTDRVGRFKRLAVKVVVLVGLGLVFGLAYDWAAPRLYGPNRSTGFPMGVVHGALMPIALPSLLMGKDVPIYATRQTGRVYKLGYIAGINLCGLLFFGVTFRRPK